VRGYTKRMSIGVSQVGHTYFFTFVYGWAYRSKPRFDQGLTVGDPREESRGRSRNSWGSGGIVWLREDGRVVSGM